MTYDDIINEVSEFNCNFIEFTGGEPLEQDNIYELIDYFCNMNFSVAIETAGYKDVSRLNPKVIKIMDIKCPDSGMSKKNNYENINYLSVNDEVKFVISSANDFYFAKELLEKYKLNEICNSVLFSPVAGEKDFNSQKLAELILSYNLPVRMQLQMHKYIWGEDAKGV